MLRANKNLIIIITTIIIINLSILPNSDSESKAGGTHD
jgi:hypothetical protein